jgi:hypothetical protein
MAALSPEQVAQVLYQAGFRGDDLVRMVAIGKRESGYNPDAHRSDVDKSKMSGDVGLFQINIGANWGTVSNALGLTDKSQLKDPLVNARAAKILFDRAGFFPWGMGSNGWEAGGDPMKGTNYGAAQQAVANAQSQGLLGQDWSAGGSGGNAQPTAAGPTGTTDTASGQTQTQMKLPPDAKVYRTNFGDTWAVFDLGGVRVSYSIGPNVDLAGVSVQDIPADQLSALGAVNAGDAEELRNLTADWGSFGAFWNSILDQVIGKNNPARNDAGVLAVIATFAGRPDMSSTELQNLLQATSWYQQHTTSQLEWNSLPEAERQKRLDNSAAQMAQTWFEFTGEAIDASDPRLVNYLEQVASGQMGYGKFTEIVKQYARGNGESPWSRQVREEEEAQRQRGVDIENTTQRVKDLARRWGIRWDEKTALDWGQKIVTKMASEADVLATLQQQASVLYPWKDPQMETAVAADPWMQTYGRVMERESDLFNPKIQAALTAGQTIYDFETQLKKSQEWLQTGGAREELYSAISEAGRRMGFT